MKTITTPYEFEGALMEQLGHLEPQAKRILSYADRNGDSVLTAWAAQTIARLETMRELIEANQRQRLTDQLEASKALIKARKHDLL